MKRTFIMILLIALVGCSLGPNGFGISGVWARPGLQGGNSAVYFNIENTGEDDRLLSASSDICDAVEIHETTMDGDQMQMHPLHSGIPIASGEDVSFQPGGLHIMLIGLENDLQVDETFDLVLSFEKAGLMTVQVTVKEP